MSFSERLRERREELDMKQGELAKKLGVTGSAIGNYENAVSFPKAEVLQKLFRALDCDANSLFRDWLDFLGPERLPDEETQLFSDRFAALGERDRKLVRALMDSMAAAPEKDNLIPFPATAPEKRSIPHFLTPPAAGYAQPVQGEDYELMELPEDAPARADFCVNVSGHSMEPYIHDGELVYVKSMEPLSMFDVGVFFVDGDVFIKQYCRDDSGAVYLLSANPDMESANKTIPADASSTVVCYGKVLLPRRLPEPVYRR
ncbi:MAG: helix-turn-helix domain-containing protein [Oscillospiraceae bacterium]|nr:helix-turn-helix domain-containing protein [Oscillospiraceae bacterium]